MYSLLAREYGWTFEQIGLMSLDEFFDSISSIVKYRQKVFPVDISLNAICTFLGIKKQKPITDTGSLKKLKGFAAFEFTEDQFQEWYKAGSPNPSKFFKRIN